MGQGRPSTECRKRRRQVNEADRIVHRCPARKPLRPGRDQRYPDRAFVERALVPQPQLAQHVAMIGGVEDGRPFAESRLVERGHDLSYRLVNHRHHAVVAGPRRPLLVGCGLVEPLVLSPHPHGRMLRRARSGRHGRRDDPVHVLVVEQTGRNIGGVWQDQAHYETERPVGPLRGAVAHEAGGGRGHVTVVGLEASAAWPDKLQAAPALTLRGVGDVAQRVVGIPVRRPADIAHHALGETVALVRPLEMHAAGQDRVIAGNRQGVREGRDAGGKGAAVRPHLDRGTALAGEEGGP